MLSIRPATAGEVQAISSRLRPEDRREVLTASGKEPSILFPRLHATGARMYSVGRPDEDPCALFGLTPVPPKDAVIWLVATPEVSRIALSLVREAGPWLAAWSKLWRLYNAVDTRNTLHIRWLRLMGFTFGEPVVRNGQSFLPFEYTQCATP